ncbi:UDP-N-acetylglucosamine 1-carboxyvinyltransferase [Pasteuria penetrans]|uniref:UDP-N-acetylglucosamine 1-carboxyvinyltransferase n=1 Tax=Pasteuria penetrans TaxID=86005 RepID=UPI0011EBD41F|nr:UDP-N-acetylglucosamine 1-carboxyvinyltransferase [Pasteuria penetrans]
MGKIVVRGGVRLRGRVRVYGAKNASLPLIAASLLPIRGRTMIHDVPTGIEDVRVIVQLLRSLGVRVTEGVGQVLVRSGDIVSAEAPYDLVCKMRASITVMGPLLARHRYAKIPLPGGCKIGSRPIDLHLKGLQALGASFRIEKGCVEGRVVDHLRGANIYLDTPSVGATQNIMMAATLAKGFTVIKNAALEPEIIDLSNFLNAMGAKVRGAGTNEIRIEGVKVLHGCEYTVIPDRIEAGTYMVGAAITRGEIFIEGAIADHLTALIAKLREMGVRIHDTQNGIHVEAHRVPLHGVDIQTQPYPGMPTDLQAQMMALLLTVPGTSLVSETVFENRFMHAEELRRMGARIRINGHTAVIDGGYPLSGARVKSTDLRAGATMVLAGLAASGQTEVEGVHHIDRGYVDLEGSLRMLGADVVRVSADSTTSAPSDPLLRRQG